MIRSKSNRIDTKTLVFASFLVGINLILTRVLVFMMVDGSVRASIGNIPLILSGLLLGPLAGLMTGIVSDLVGFLLNSHGFPFHPGFTLSSGLTGFIPGIVVLIGSHFGKNRYSLANVITANLVVYLLVSGLLNTWWLTHIIGTGFWVLLPVRLASHGVITFINTLLIYALVKSFQRTGLVSDNALN